MTSRVGRISHALLLRADGVWCAEPACAAGTAAAALALALRCSPAGPRFSEVLEEIEPLDASDPSVTAASIFSVTETDRPFTQLGAGEHRVSCAARRGTH